MPAHLRPVRLVQTPVPEPARDGARFQLDAGTLRVEVLRNVDALRAIVPDWAALADVALEPNVFYEPFMALPALEHLGADRNLAFVLVYGRERRRPGGPERLCGLFPLVRGRSFHGMPVTHYQLWDYIHCFLHTPLVHRNCGPDVVATFLTWFAGGSNGSLMKLSRIRADGPFAEALTAQLFRQGLPVWVSLTYVRALMHRSRSAEEYLQGVVSSGRMKEYRRQQRRLAELGTLRFESMPADADPEPWLDEFLRLEEAGWKGRNGSALGSRPDYRAFFRQAARDAFTLGRLHMLALCLDGRAIAHKCNFSSGCGAFSFKVAYDERFHKYSPGVLLEIENMRRFHAQSELTWMDSCADPDHPMIDHLWAERRMIQSLLVGAGSKTAGLLVALVPLMKWLKYRGVPYRK